MKWTAIVLSVTLLAITLLLLQTRRAVVNPAAAPASLELGNPVLAR